MSRWMTFSQLGLRAKICARCYHGRKIKTIFGRTVLQRPAELKKKALMLLLRDPLSKQNKTKEFQDFCTTRLAAAIHLHQQQFVRLWRSYAGF
jgi:hypothetical protein